MNFVLNSLYSHDLIFLLRYFFSLNFDIFHFREIGKFLPIWVLFAKILKRKKVIITIPHIRYCIPNNIPFGKFFRKIYKFSLKKADLIIVLANYMKNELLKNYNLKSIVINSGHPIPPNKPLKSFPPIFLWVARLKNWKKPELFLYIAKNLSHLNAKFILIGSQNDYFKKEILEYSQKNKNFIFIPGVPIDKDNKFYEKASLLVNTSLNEWFPNSFIQAWLRETPVISLHVDPDEIICKKRIRIRL
ncbi:MAG: glycosyltransferase family 4 protein [Promethearchaeota archaeon]